MMVVFRISNMQSRYRGESGGYPGYIVILFEEVYSDSQLEHLYLKEIVSIKSLHINLRRY